MSLATAFGLAAGALQGLAYIIYVRDARTRPGSGPGGISWLAASAATAGALAVGLSAGLPLPVLALPAVCLALSLGLALRAIAGGALRPAPWDAAVASLALLLLAAAAGLASEGASVAAAIIGALLAGLGAPLSLPLLTAGTRPLCRYVWSAAAGLAALAVIAAGLPWPVLVYPLTAQALHLFLGLATPVPAARRRDPVEPEAGRSGNPRAA